MASFGYAAMCEQTPVKQLVSDLVAAEEAGFDFSVISDHYLPRPGEQGHWGHAWSALGAAAQATWQLPLMIFGTYPTFHYHPAIVAQQAATMGVLSDGRFTLGLGAGGNLDEHVAGQAWPTTRLRHERLAEAVQIIRELFTGEYVTFHGKHFQVDRAKLHDLPASRVPIGIAVSAQGSVGIAAQYADAIIATEPDPGLTTAFRAVAGPRKLAYGQIALRYDADEAASIDAAADDAAAVVPRGLDVLDTSRHVEAVREYIEAGFTHIALVQVGAEHQGQFIAWAADELLPALRELG